MDVGVEELAAKRLSGGMAQGFNL